MFKLTIFSFIASIILTWRPLGHMLTAQIAENYLNNSTSYQKIQTAIFDLNNLTDGRSNTFVESACWPDDIKASETQFWFQWHFSNREINLDGTETIRKYNTNILQALNYTFEGISDKSINGKFSIALFSRFLIHLVGDIHQPLHVSTLFNATLPSGDEGGNLIQIFPYDNSQENFLSLTSQQISKHQAEQENLHAYFDDLLNQYEKVERPLNSKTKEYVVGIANQIMKEFPIEDFTDILKDKPEQWELIEYFYSKNYVYGPLIDKQTTVIDKQYYDDNSRYVRRQLALGGYRLAFLINKYY